MNKAILFIILYHIALSTFGQLFQIDQQGQDFYNIGSKMIRMGDYKSADSLLTLALCTYKNENVYYNRAISRLFLSDTIGFCSDMNIVAYQYFDSHADVMFNDICCSSVDTSFYNKKLEPSNGADIRYYEILRRYKYEALQVGTFHDIKFHDVLYSADYNCEQDLLLGIYSKPTNITAIYQIEDGTKYYYRTKKPIVVNNNMQYNAFKRKGQKLLNRKYSYLKSDNNLEDLKVFFEIYTNSSGEIIKTVYAGTFPEVELEKRQLEFENDILGLMNFYPKITPARFMNKKVNYRTYDFIEF